MADENNKQQKCLNCEKFMNLLKGLKTILSNNKEFLSWLISYIICLLPLLWFALGWKYEKDNPIPWLVAFSFYVIVTLIFIFALLKPNLKNDRNN